MTNTHVHVYEDTREVRLQRLVHVLWNHLTPYQQAELGPGIVKAGMGWAIPDALPDHRDDNDWLTVDQLSYELGLSPSAIRNWPQRYDIKPVNSTYRWGDVQRILRERRTRRHNNQTG